MINSAQYDVESIRRDFPILQKRIHGKPLVYLDNAASSQHPVQVINAVKELYESGYANIHRGVHQLSQDATKAYENARATVRGFIHADCVHEVVFTSGTTGSINLVAQSFARPRLQKGDEVLITHMEHHSNIVPWQIVCAQTGAELKVVPISDKGELEMDRFAEMLSDKTRMVSVTQVSNALGTVNPVQHIIAMAHAKGIPVLVDGAQAIPHMPVDVQKLDADFYAFSGHKIYGPTGIGVLYGKEKLLKEMPPYQGGGDMIEQVSFERTTYAGLPNKFEAGTPHIAGAVGLAAAIEWLAGVGFERIGAHEQGLLDHATARLAAVPGLEIKGTASRKASLVSWVMVEPPIGTLDIGMQLDLRGICIRTGHHCCQPLMDRLGISSTARASFGVYNTLEEIDRLADALLEIATAAREKARRVTTTDMPGMTAAPTAVSADEVQYPGAVADSPEAAADEIAEIFELLPDWPMRHQQIMDLGERLQAMPASLKTEQSYVPGCQSQVHLIARIRPDSPDILEFVADSDAGIVRGLIAILQRLYSGQRTSAILAFDAHAFFARLGLDEHLSMTRRNGLSAMVERIRRLAAEHVSA